MKKIYKKKNPEKERLWRKINKERRRNDAEKRKKDNEYKKAWAAKNKGRYKHKGKWKPKDKKYARDWKEKNKDKVRNYKRKRKELKKVSAITDPIVINWESEWRKKIVVCSYCLEQLNGADAHMDHIIPLSKFGQHEMFNLCISCPTCNLRKNSKNPFDFIKLIEDENFHKKNSNLSNVTNLLQDFLKDERGSVV